MTKDTMPTFEAMSPPPDAPSEPYRRQRSRTTSRMDAEDRREFIRNALLWITVAALAIAVLTFLISVNAVISVWFRNQWAPIARSVAALAVIALCLFVMIRLVRRDVPALK